MQLNAPVSANDAVVVPLPPTDFRIASASLSALRLSVEPIVTNAETYIQSWNDGNTKPECRSAVLSALEADTLGTAIGQARRAVQLLSASSADGAVAIGSAIDGDVVSPLQKAIDYAGTVKRWDSNELLSLATTLRPALNGAAAWNDMLQAQPKVVVGRWPAGDAAAT